MQRFLEYIHMYVRECQCVSVPLAHNNFRSSWLVSSTFEKKIKDLKKNTKLI